jgi:hypothetical protein
MTEQLEVISDFLDGEAFEPHALGQALAAAEGRQFLTDSLLLRYAVEIEVTPVTVAAHVRAPGRRRSLWAAAAILVALVGGYQLGSRELRSDSSEPPPPGRTVEMNWQALSQEDTR